MKKQLIQSALIALAATATANEPEAPTFDLRLVAAPTYTTYDSGDVVTTYAEEGDNPGVVLGPGWQGPEDSVVILYAHAFSPVGTNGGYLCPDHGGDLVQTVTLEIFGRETADVTDDYAEVRYGTATWAQTYWSETFGNGDMWLSLIDGGVDYYHFWVWTIHDYSSMIQVGYEFEAVNNQQPEPPAE